MTLKNIELNERKKLTRAYPVLVAAFPKAGKTTSLEFLSDDDKARTVFFDAENKGLSPDDNPDLYRSIYRLKPADLPARSTSYKDIGNIKYLTAEDFLKRINAAIAHKDIDRVVIDSFTALVSELERRFMKVHNGFNVWNTYNDMLHDFFADIKEETFTHGKFVYILGHYVPSKDKKDKDGEQYAKVSGSKYYRLVESNFNTVLSISNFQFTADNTDEFTSTRIKRSLNPLQTEDNNMDTLEYILTGTELPEVN